MELSLFRCIRKHLIRSPSPSLQRIRVGGSKAAILFIHGFSGRSDDTWKSMIDLIQRDQRLRSWDIYSLGYPSSLLSIDIPRVWSADPGLDTLALSLETSLAISPASNYQALAIVAHSMGGLIVQRAICNNRELAAKVTHLGLFGVPSNGLAKALFFAPIKRQLRDMASGSAFIRALRRDWLSTFGEAPPFRMMVVAGNRDEFVNGASSLEPFPGLIRRVVPGNHIEMINPSSSKDEAYSLLTSFLCGSVNTQDYVDAAEVALELRDFNSTIAGLWNARDAIDDNAVVTLALALESVGRREDALDILKRRSRIGSNTDLRGTLAGRLKRRWLTGRLEADYLASRELYLTCLDEAERSFANDQAYYHAINVAFLGLMMLPPSSPVSVEVTDMAQRALNHCARSPESVWSHATTGEANLMLGNLEQALSDYSKAAKIARPQEVDSFYYQAAMVALRVYDASAVEKLKTALKI